jgi:hypothetical protein
MSGLQHLFSFPGRFNWKCDNDFVLDTLMTIFLPVQVCHFCQSVNGQIELCFKGHHSSSARQQRGEPGTYVQKGTLRRIVIA